ncbi:MULTISPECIES: hypothetical protein [Paraburkholderia]|uniref:hypothetical protein n=1 Tax=Paraburkholderia TaxID=1822464 RepID=UPI00224C9AE1|nr:MULTISPECIES: hypothetical protein [Paraburkholderia]MCX4156152.1 hypothetical protein [Paraburkholderia aspalathi]MDN7165558.1 hypothetical protein [Paraburkholderia sp. SECH2]MDQ6394044.1 hypothetical protein [Paraburkholderia aspalathi]
MAEVQQQEVSEKREPEAARLEVLFGRASLGIFTSAVLVIVTAMTIGGHDLDPALKFSVEWYFFAAAASGGSIFFESLVDSIFVPDVENSERIKLYNRGALTAALLWGFGGAACWFFGAAALADHYKIEWQIQLGMFLVLAVPAALVLLVAAGDSLYVLFKRIWKRVMRSSADTTKVSQ